MSAKSVSLEMIDLLQVDFQDKIKYDTNKIKQKVRCINMTTSALVISIILTIAVLLLSLLTISKGYGYKHTIDPLVDDENKETSKEDADVESDERT